jgi:hypothetical protein
MSVAVGSVCSKQTAICRFGINSPRVDPHKNLSRGPIAQRLEQGTHQFIRVDFEGVGTGCNLLLSLRELGLGELLATVCNIGFDHIRRIGPGKNEAAATSS